MRRSAGYCQNSSPRLARSRPPFPRHRWLWALIPLVLLASPTLFGILSPIPGPLGFVRHLGIIWLVLGVGGLVFRTVQLFFIRDVQTGMVWMTKILTDPFHDLKLYHKAPVALMRGELIDPTLHSQRG